MYIAARHRQDRIEAMHDLMATHALGMLVTLDDGLPDADHPPFEFVADHAHGPHGVLRAHVARANPVWRREGQQVLVVFRGPAGYITPDPIEKLETQGRVVPTWNYHVVHVHGRLRAIEDPAWLLAQVRRQTDRQERVLPHPWSVEDAPRAFIDGMLRAIVGIEIAIERIEGKWKGSAPAAR